MSVGDPCSIDGCDGPIAARGWCRKHYLRWYKTGNPMKVRPRHRRTGARHHDPGEHVSTPMPTPCREWLGLRDGKGYPLRGHTRVHRWVVETAGEDQFGTPWDPKLVVMHLCDNPPCFRFDHLRLGDIAENQVDMAKKDRGASKLSNEQVRQLRDEYARSPSRETARRLAARFGIHHGTATQIARGKQRRSAGGVITEPRPGRLRDDPAFQAEVIRTLHDEGLTLSRAAERLGRSISAIHKTKTHMIKEGLWPTAR